MKTRARHASRRARNARAQRFYERAGFALEGDDGGSQDDPVRELVILRYAARVRVGYEWSHHQRPARLAGVNQDTIDALTAGEVPRGIPDDWQAALEAVDAVVAGRSIPADIQQRFVAAHGNAGIVELVVICGLYGIMADMVNAFDVKVEPGLPTAPF